MMRRSSTRATPQGLFGNIGAISRRKSLNRYEYRT
jgi:hypothetical protein